MNPPDESRLWQPLQLGAAHLKNRLVLAPMTRRRADADGTPNALMAEYYAQRCSFGLLVTEGVYPSEEGRGYPNQPGLTSEAHEHGWAEIATKVHAEDTPVFAQIMHAGRVTHPDVTGTSKVLAPSAIPVDDHRGHHPAAQITPATAQDLAYLIDVHVDAAKRARRAGLDGIELHAANGYLLQQFLAPSTNRRADHYGGSPLNRARFVIELTEAIVEAIGAERVGIRVSPGVNTQGALETDPRDMTETYASLFENLAPHQLAYVSIVNLAADSDIVQTIRSVANTPIILNTGFATVTDRYQASTLIEHVNVDAIAVGRPAIANPDLPERWRHNHVEASPDQTTFYTGGSMGYTDYPLMGGA